MQRVVFIDRMRPEDAGQIAEIWAEHDRTELPARLGVTARTLFRFRGLYVHLVESSESGLVDRIAAAARETRTPVKLPGPFTTMIPPRSPRRVPAACRRSRTAATSVAEYVRPSSSACPRISRSRPASRPNATEPEGPQVSMAKMGARMSAPFTIAYF